MKKILVASDKFKGTLSGKDIYDIIKSSAERFFSDCVVEAVPAADGGEGTVYSFVNACGAEYVEIEVTGPHFEKVKAAYAMLNDTAIIEMCAAAGMTLAGSIQNPATATTYGVGELIRDAINRGASHVLLGLGGSATNDAGCGCACALGAQFLDADGNSFIPVGESLHRVKDIYLSEINSVLEHVDIQVMCDVDNPLYGTEGAAHVFSPQKGADPVMVEILDKNLSALDSIIRSSLGKDVGNIPGAGAAGGMGAGCVAFLNAKLKSGARAVLDAVGFDKKLEGTDMVITGEGCMDYQSAHGKLISAVASAAKKRSIPVIAIVGCTDNIDGSELYDSGVTAVFTISRDRRRTDLTHENSFANYKETADDIFRLINALGK